MINRNLLDSKLALKGKNQNHIAKLIGKTIGTTNLKFNGKIKFTFEEIKQVKDYLNLTNDEVVEIFINE
mgnify:FL=1